MVVGFAGASNTNVWQAFGTVALGWLRFGDAANYWTANCPPGRCFLAGVELATKRQQLLAILQKKITPFVCH